MTKSLSGRNLEKSNVNGMTITGETGGIRDDDRDWPDAVQWTKEQIERPRALLATLCHRGDRSP